jgi:hypothetical protein
MIFLCFILSMGKRVLYNSVLFFEICLLSDLLHEPDLFSAKHFRLFGRYPFYHLFFRDYNCFLRFNITKRRLDIFLHNFTPRKM